MRATEDFQVHQYLSTIVMLSYILTISFIIYQVFDRPVSPNAFETFSQAIQLVAMSSSMNAITIGSLIKKDLTEAYFLPQKPSSYIEEYKFFNSTKYRIFDYPTSSATFRRLVSPCYHLAAAGDEIPVLMERGPELFLKQHWKLWLPAYPTVIVKSPEEGLHDDVPIVTRAALEAIPEDKHFIHPDILYELQLKSSLLDVKAPTPRHMDENHLTFPCLLKIDMSSGGRGNRLVKNQIELAATLRNIREDCGWHGDVLYQEVIPRIKEVPSFQFYLHKSGELYWLGTTIGGFEGFGWTGAVVDWDKHEEYEKLVYEEFTVPIKNYLQKHGYFGLVTFEVIITDQGKYLVDLNPRIGSDTTHLLLAKYMALDFDLKHSAIFSYNKHELSPKEVIARANAINNKGKGLVVVLSAANDEKGCESHFSIFANTPDEVRNLYYQFNNNEAMV